MKPACYREWNMSNPKCKKCIFNNDCKRDTLKGVGKFAKNTKAGRHV